MNNMQKILVQASFQKVIPIADAAAGLFYGRLFELDPSVRPMFRGDMITQGKHLMAALKMVVMGLDRLEQLLPAVEALARRHNGYGVKDEHYETVGAALIWTLQKGLGDAFTPSVAAAWVAAYGLLANVMKAASAQAAQESIAIHMPAAVHVAAATRISQPPSRISQPPSSRIITADALPMSQRAPLSQQASALSSHSSSHSSALSPHAPLSSRAPLSQRMPMSQRVPLSQRIPPTRRVPHAPIPHPF
jgi:hemoglobin-like flavoprotein